MINFKNIQRRVYDALNVMNAIGIIEKGKNKIKFTESKLKKCQRINPKVVDKPTNYNSFDSIIGGISKDISRISIIIEEKQNNLVNILTKCCISSSLMKINNLNNYNHQNNNNNNKNNNNNQNISLNKNLYNNNSIYTNNKLSTDNKPDERIPFPFSIVKFQNKNISSNNSNQNKTAKNFNLINSNNNPLFVKSKRKLHPSWNF